MKKRLLALLLSLCLIAGLLPTAALAATATALEDTWDGTIDTSWYQSTESEFTLTTAEQLAGLAILVNNGNTFNGKTVLLGSNLNLSGHEWTSIGTGNNVSNYFGGTFDGQHFQISNLTSQNSTTYYHGLFGVISAGGTVQNLYLVAADLYSNDTSLRMGILADWVNNGTVENCYTSGKVHNVSGDELLGGLVGTCTAGSKIIGCSSDAEIISDYYDDGDTYSDCDTVGGIVGQWENATSDALISDCWFGGSICCGFDDSGVGGILGANFDFYDSDPGVTIKNCIVSTKDIHAAEPGNITWIAAVVNSTVENCLWPDSPPDDVSLEGDAYEDYGGNYLAVVKLVVDWSTGTAGADPDFDQNACGQAISNFTDESVLNHLQTNAGSNIQWVAGKEHPVFQRQAAIVTLDEAISKIAQQTEWTVRQEDANDAENVKSILETELRDMNLDTSSTVTVATIEPASNGKDGSFTFTVELGKNGISRFVEVSGGIILAAPLTQEAPDFSPELNNRNTNSITLNTVQATNVNGAGIEYGISSDGGITWNWQNSPEFTGLSSGTVYTFALRYGAVIGDTSYRASENGPVSLFSTNSSSSGGGPTTYAITTPDRVIGGAVTASPSRASKGATVTIAAKPDEGYALDTLTVTDASGNQLPLTDKGDGKYTFPMPASKVTVSASFTAVATDPDPAVNPFTDVSESAYYYDAVLWAAENGITTGTAATTFGPDLGCTRAQVVTFLWRAAGSPESGASAGNPFTDLSPNAYYYDAVLWAVEQGVTVGTTATTFSPDLVCTRAQCVTFLHRYEGSPTSSVSNSFTDVLSGAYYEGAVQWAAANGVTVGTTATTFSPDDHCTRGQIVTFLYRALAQ